MKTTFSVLVILATLSSSIAVGAEAGGVEGLGYNYRFGLGVGSEKGSLSLGVMPPKLQNEMKSEGRVEMSGIAQWGLGSGDLQFEEGTASNRYNLYELEVAYYPGLAGGNADSLFRFYLPIRSGIYVATKGHPLDGRATFGGGAGFQVVAKGFGRTKGFLGFQVLKRVDPFASKSSSIVARGSDWPGVDSMFQVGLLW